MALISPATKTDPPIAMAQGKKFLFDVTFEVDQPPLGSPAANDPAEDETADDDIEDEPEAATFTEEEMEAARDEGFAAGREEGIRDAASGIESKIIDLLGNISVGFDEIFALQNTRNAEIFDISINAALAVTRKCFPYLTKTHGAAEIDDMVREVLSDIVDEPKAVINVPPNLQSSLEARVAAIAQHSGFEGRVSVLADPGLDGSDCRIDWTGGSAERGMDVLWRRIDEIIERNLGMVTAIDGVPRDDASKADSEETTAAAPSPITDSASAAALGASTPTPMAMPETSAPAPETTPESAPEIPPEDASNGPVSGAFDGSQANQDDLGELVESLSPETPETAAVPNATADHLRAGPSDVEPGINDVILTDNAEDGASSAPSIDGESNG